MATCIITGDTITATNDSKAHVIPSALGGRLKPPNILSQRGNALLNDKVDLPLFKALHPFMALIGGSRDNGKNKSVKVFDELNQSYKFAFGKPLSLAQPHFSFENLNDGSFKIEAAGNTRKDLETVLGRAKKRLPELDIKNLVKGAVAAKALPGGMLEARLQVGESEMFPAAFVAASIYAVHNGHNPHPDLIAYIKAFDPNANPLCMPPDTFYFFAPQGLINTDCEVAHSIVLISDVDRGKSLVVISYFNIFNVAVVLPYCGALKHLCVYAVDVISGDQFSPSVDENGLRSIPWEATHTMGNQSFNDEIKSRISKFMEFRHRHTVYSDMREIIENVLQPAEGRVFNEEDANQVVNAIMNYLISRNLVRER